MEKVAWGSGVRPRKRKKGWVKSTKSQACQCPSSGKDCPGSMTENQSQLATDLGLGLDCDTSAWKWLSSWLICKTPRKILRAPSLAHPEPRRPASHQQWGQPPGEQPWWSQHLQAWARHDSLQPGRSWVARGTRPLPQDLMMTPGQADLPMDFLYLPSQVPPTGCPASLGSRSLLPLLLGCWSVWLLFPNFQKTCVAPIIDYVKGLPSIW